MTMKTDADMRADDARYKALDRSLTNHTPPSQVVAVIEDVREMARHLGARIITACPDSRERSLALTHLEETTMWAVKSLVLPD
jgi:hypothetical protein